MNTLIKSLPSSIYQETKCSYKRHNWKRKRHNYEMKDEYYIRTLLSSMTEHEIKSYLQQRSFQLTPLPHCHLSRDISIHRSDPQAISVSTILNCISVSLIMNFTIARLGWNILSAQLHFCA